MAKKFPGTIYVTREEAGTREEYLAVRDEGVQSESFAATTDVAVYKLAEVGKITVTRQYKGAKRARA